MDPATLLNACFAFKLRQSSRLMTKFFDSFVAPIGIRYTQLCMLIILEKYRGDSITNVSNKIGMDRTTLNRVMAKMKSSNLIDIDEKWKGYRSSIDKYCITDKGREAIQDGLVIWSNNHELILKKIAFLITKNDDVSIFREFKSDLDNFEEALEQVTFKKKRKPRVN